MDDFDLS